METKAFNPEEQLRKIINLINENKSDTISVRKIRDIIGSDDLSGKRINNPFVQGKSHMEFNKNEGYRENYIS
jgi:ABC-type taurine transport system substrate-binding protein